MPFSQLTAEYPNTKAVAMLELLIVVVSVIAIIVTKKFWSTEISVIVAEYEVDNQSRLNDLNNRVDDIITKQNGKWVNIKDIQSKIK